MVASTAFAHRPSLIGVLYAEDFDETGDPAPSSPDPAPEPEIIEPVFTATELDAARAEAQAAGRAEAERGLLASRNHLLGLLAGGMADAQLGAQQAAEAAAEGVARCMLSALAACLPALCEHHGAVELRTFVRALLPALTDEPRIIVRVNPHMAGVMQDEIDGLDAEMAERIQLLPTDVVPPGDVRISWADGSAVRDTARARAAFEDGLAGLGLLQPEQANA